MALYNLILQPADHVRTGICLWNQLLSRRVFITECFELYKLYVKIKYTLYQEINTYWVLARIWLLKKKILFFFLCNVKQFLDHVDFMQGAFAIQP